MRFVFATDELRNLYTNREGAARYGVEVVEAFFRVMAIIRNAGDERDLRTMRSLHYEQLKGKRSHQHSLRLNRQWRLILERDKDAEGRFLWIITIEDYH
ncbi:MAG: type II toxin-antitoxin system RelE/ParE family toxin [Caldilineaceae bacterium]